jgi:transposase
LCASCQWRSQTPRLSISTQVDVSSFRSFFDHQAMRGYSLTSFQRSALVTLWAVNISSQQIATLTGCDDRTITKWVDHYRSDTNLVDKPRSGRPHVTDAAEDQALEELERSQPFTTPRRIRAELEMKIAARTIRRRLNAVGLLDHISN